MNEYQSAIGRRNVDEGLANFTIKWSKLATKYLRNLNTFTNNIGTAFSLSCLLIANFFMSY